MRFAVCLWLVHDVCLWFSEPADCQLAVLKHCVSEAIKFIHPAQETLYCSTLVQSLVQNPVPLCLGLSWLVHNTTCGYPDMDVL
jgi:hypothetical protein